MRNGMRIRPGFAWLLGVGLLAACQSGASNSTASDANRTSSEAAADASEDSNMADAMNTTDTFENAYDYSPPMDDNEVLPPPR